MKVENQKLIKIFIDALAHKIRGVRETNETAVEHINQIGIRQQNASNKTQENRQPLQLREFVFQNKIGENRRDNRANQIGDRGCTYTDMSHHKNK